MRFRRIHVEGYGNLRDHTITLTDGINLLVGPNEAGKSTLRDFVRALLYGFASRKGAESRRERREPIGGGPYGGWADIVTSEGEEIRLERRQDPQRISGALTLRRGSGETADEAFLEELLGGVTRDYFARVHAFGIAELEDAKKLARDDIEDLLFGASARQHPGRLKQGRDELDGRKQKLFTPRGKGEIGELLKGLESTRGEIRELRSRVGEVELLTAKQERVRRRIGELEKKISSLHAAREAVEAVQAARNELEDARKRRAELSYDPRVLDAGEEIARLEERRPEILGRRDDAEELAGRIAGIEAEFAEGRRELGGELTDDHVAALEDPESLKAEIRAFDAEFVGAAHEIERAQGALREKQARLEGIHAAGASWHRILRAMGWVFLAAGLPLGVLTTGLFREWRGGAAVTLLLGLVGALLLLAARRAAGGGKTHKIERDLQVTETMVEEGQTQHAELARRWRGWLSARGLPEDMDTDAALEAIRDANELKRRLEERKALAQKREDTLKEIESFQAEVRALVESLGREPPRAAEDLIGTPGKLVEELVRASTEREAAGKVNEEIARHQKELEAAFAELEAARVGRPPLSPDDAQALRSEDEALEGQERTFSEERSGLFREDGDLARQIEDLRGSDRLARLRREEEGLTSEIRQRALEWSAAAVARRLIDEAARHFQDLHQPAVIRKASEFFRVMTGGAFERIIRPVDEGVETLICVRSSGAECRPETLSRGTHEQLYLALRFAAVQTASPARPPLPILMDDVLVNFDDARVARAVDVIAELSKTHQILYFTCHEHIARLLERAPVPVQLSRLQSVPVAARP